ncbi:hypothetical protein LTR27_008018 [Elasticomyces elasticus]|nr:hypothetical protein LTR27_008018 [Elasticomyces elasticus]
MSTPTLFGLPPELRNRIWELVVIDPNPIQAHRLLESDEDSLRHFPNSERILPQQPAITHVNHKTREEALPIFYGQNIFWIPHKTAVANDIDVKTWWRSFANKSARKHMNHIIYALQDDLSVGSTCSGWIDFDIRTIRGAAVLCVEQASSRNICSCAIEELFAEAEIRSVVAALTVMRRSIYPRMVATLDRRDTVDLLIELEGRDDDRASCLDCGKVP